MALLGRPCFAQELSPEASLVTNTIRCFVSTDGLTGLREQGLKDVEVRGLGWRFSYGTLGIVTGLVIATKTA